MNKSKTYKSIKQALGDIIQYLKEGYSTEFAVKKANARLKDYYKYRRDNPEFNQLHLELREKYRNFEYLQSFISKGARDESSTS